jgi:acyl-CoA thioester hydrolase
VEIVAVLRALYKTHYVCDVPSAALATHDFELRVRYAETDQMGVVYHTNYLIWCEIGRTELIRSLTGVSYAKLEEQGVLLAVAELSIRYHGAARYDNLIRVRTTLSEARSRSVTFDYLISNAESGERLASARTVLISLDESGRPIVMPEQIRQRLVASE